MDNSKLTAKVEAPFINVIIVDWQSQCYIDLKGGLKKNWSDAVLAMCPYQGEPKTAWITETYYVLN